MPTRAKNSKKESTKIESTKKAVSKKPSPKNKSAKKQPKPNKLDLTTEFNFACKVAQESATIVQTFYVGSAEVEYKDDKSPITEADRSANEHIIHRIRTTFPNDGILSEESQDDLSRLDKERVWIIDPLDGTKEFIARNGEFSVMIGLAIDGEAVLGVIMQPDPGLLYAGARGVGAFLFEEDEQIPLQVSDKTEPREMILACSRSHRPSIIDSLVRTMHITQERISGSVGLKIGLISRQLAEIYPHPSPGCKEWDSCAGHALLEAAGGVMTDCWGNPIRYNKADIRAHNGILASNGGNHAALVEVIAKACEDEGFNEEDGFW